MLSKKNILALTLLLFCILPSSAKTYSSEYYNKDSYKTSENNNWLTKETYVAVKGGLVHSSNIKIENYCYKSGGSNQSTPLGGESDDSLALGIGIGKNISDHFSLELEYIYSFQRNFLFRLSSTIGEAQNTKIHSQSLVATAYLYGTPIHHFIRPYLAFGIGPTINTMNDFNIGADCMFRGKSTLKLAWHVSAGLSTEYNNTDFTGEVKFFNKNSVESHKNSVLPDSPPRKILLQELMFLVGARVKF